MTAQKIPGGLGQLGAAAGRTAHLSNQERGADFLLRPADQAPRVPVRDAQRLGGPAERAELGHGGEQGAEAVKLILTGEQPAIVGGHGLTSLVVYHSSPETIIPVRNKAVCELFCKDNCHTPLARPGRGW